MVFIKNIAELVDLSEQITTFEARIINLADKVDLSLNDFHCDHISVRCHLLATAERWRQGFMKCGDLLSDKEINGRPICLFSLKQPLLVVGKEIDCVELPYPGKTIYANEEWEHIELVIPCEANVLHQRALALLSDRGLMRPDVKVKCSNPKGDKETLLNPTLAITDGIVTIKFHPYSIREVIASEKIKGC